MFRKESEKMNLIQVTWGRTYTVEVISLKKYSENQDLFDLCVCVSVKEKEKNMLIAEDISPPFFPPNLFRNYDMVRFARRLR